MEAKKISHQVKPSIARGAGIIKATWLEYNQENNHFKLVVGEYKQGKLKTGKVLADNLKYTLKPRIEFIDDEEYIVLLSCSKEFKLRVWHCSVPDDRVVKIDELFVRGCKCGAFDLVRSRNSVCVVWEAWGENAKPFLVSSSFKDGSWSDVTQLTPKGISANWPSIAEQDEILWIAFCVPNKTKTGYDCMLANETKGNIRFWKINRNDDSNFNIYPELTVDRDGRLYMIWLHETEREYYHLEGKFGDSTYCCYQDPDSRARRSILWNETIPELVRISMDADCLLMERLDIPFLNNFNNKTLHYPALKITDKDEFLFVYDRATVNGIKCFQHCGVRLDGSDKNLQKTENPTIEAGFSSVLPSKASSRSLISGDSLIIIGENAIFKNGKPERMPETEATEVKVLSQVIESRKAFIPEVRSKDNIQPVELTTDIAEEEKKSYYGNIHIHSEISICRRDTQQSVDFNYRWAKDIMGESFSVITDHARDMHMCCWRYCMNMVEFFNFPGVYVALPGYEWATGTPDGHSNVIFRSPENTKLRNLIDTNGSIEELWKELKGFQVITIPHHPATSPMVRTWEKYCPELEPLVEIFQDRRGNYEYANAPFIPGEGCPEQGAECRSPEGFVSEALLRGHRLGFCSGGDHMGLSMTGLLAEIPLNREGIFDAFTQRKCFAVTQPRIRLEFEAECRENKAMGGQELVVKNGDFPTIKINVKTPTEINYVALIYGTEEYLKFECANECEFNKELQLKECLDYLYVRVVLKDCNMGWSSPIWFKCIQ